MSDLDYYVHFQSKTMNPCTLLKEAYEHAVSTWLCVGCANPKLSVQEIDVNIQESTPEGPLNFVSGCGVPLARRSFLLRLGEKRVERDLIIGKVFGPAGALLDDWVTFRGKRGVIIRGTKHAGNRVCPECGRNLYFAMHPRYLYPAPANDVDILESDLFGLVVSERLAREINIKSNIRGVTIERLKVLSEPKDGLPSLSF